MVLAMVDAICVTVPVEQRDSEGRLGHHYCRQTTDSLIVQFFLSFLLHLSVTPDLLECSFDMCSQLECILAGGGRSFWF